MSSDLTVLTQEALAERPLTKERLLAHLPKDGELYPIVEMFTTVMCSIARENTLLKQNRETGRTVSRKAIRNVLLEYTDYLRGFTDIDDKVHYLGREVDSKGSVAIRLAQQLEDEFFPNKEIDTPVLLTAIRAALIYQESKVNNVIPEIDLLIAYQSYIDAGKTKKRTRMPLKLMVELFPFFHRKVVVKAIEDCQGLEIIKSSSSNGLFIRSTIPIKNSNI
jgi:hypothetical protein